MRSISSFSWDRFYWCRRPTQSLHLENKSALAGNSLQSPGTSLFLWEAICNRQQPVCFLQERDFSISYVFVWVLELAAV
jgi:hypothetical protein